ncbi:3-deoxy-D-manno-octulosonic acid transferase [bacterium]|nr:3-deoxy-D-manno-octulosonic acid transferase [bacterium]
MIWIIYNLFMTFFFLLGGVPLLLYSYLLKHGIRERFGFIRRIPGNLIWIHTASVGEVRIASIIIPKLKQNFPDHKILLTVLTKTGKEQARKLLGKSVTVSFVPLDHPIFLHIALKRVNPKMLILTEAELWYNLINTVRKKTPNLFLINGRVAPDTYNWAKYLKPYFEKILSFFRLILMKSAKDANRIAALGAPIHKVKVLGDLKFSQSPITRELKEIELPANKKFIAAGSTHKREDKIILRAFSEVRKVIPDVMLLIAPRYTARAPKLAKISDRLGLSHALRTKDQLSAKADVYIIDTIGELCSFYAKADIAFVGGTLTNIGGHNPLEPAALGKPVLLGPYYWSTKDSVNILIRGEGAKIVRDENELTNRLIQMLSNEKMAAKMGQNARETVEKAQRIADEYINEIIKAAK